MPLPVGKIVGIPGGWESGQRSHGRAWAWRRVCFPGGLLISSAPLHQESDAFEQLWRPSLNHASTLRRSGRLAVALLLLLGGTANAQTTVKINDYLGYMYETGTFPPSLTGDVMVGVGRVSATFPPVEQSATAELTWVLYNLNSTGQVYFPPFVVVRYSDGRLDTYEDPAFNSDFGINPVPGVAPSTFSDGAPYLGGSLTNARLFYNTVTKTGSFTATVTFDSGYRLSDLGTNTGYTFSTVVGRSLTTNPPIPTGYDLQATGSTLAPCVVTNTVSGTVTDDAGTPLGGVTINLYNVVSDGSGADILNFLDTGLSSGDGTYSFTGLQLDKYFVEAVVPAGYTSGSDLGATFEPACGVAFQHNVRLDRQQIVPAARTIGFWKHQFNVALTGRGTAQVSRNDLLTYLTAIRSRFVLKYDVFSFLNGVSDLDEANGLLSLKKASMNARAQEQLLALILNVVSGRLATFTVISDDGATVSMAISYAASLIVDTYAPNDETAKTICDLINNGAKVPVDVIPPKTPQIAYRPLPNSGPPAAVVLYPNEPNPFNPSTRISFSLPAAERVDLSIYDVGGRRLATLVSAVLPAGEHSRVWNGRDEGGNALASGVYLYRLRTGSSLEQRTMVLIK